MRNSKDMALFSEVNMGRILGDDVREITGD